MLYLHNTSYFVYNTNMIRIRLYEERIKKGLTLCELEKLTKISKSKLNNIENAITSPTLNDLYIISKALNINIEDLYETAD